MAYANQARNQSLARTAPPRNAVGALKDLINEPKIMARFSDVLGKKAPQFLASVVSAVAGNPALQKAEPKSVLGAAMVAATLNLDINPSLGFSAIVPYNRSRKDVVTGRFSQVTEGQFQIMTKGFVQLAIRSGQYRTINAAEIYADEFESVDIVTGEVIIHPVADGYRSRGEDEMIVGYVAYIELLSGFRKCVYWSMEKILNHAKKFSKSYDTRTGNFIKGSAWDTNREAMCRKTVLKNTLSSWGILSVEMQRAIISDQGVIGDMDNIDEIDYVDNPEGDEAQDEAKQKPKAKKTAAPVEQEPTDEQQDADTETTGTGPEQFDDDMLDDLWEDKPF